MVLLGSMLNKKKMKNTLIQWVAGIASSIVVLVMIGFLVWPQNPITYNWEIEVTYQNNNIDTIYKKEMLYRDIKLKSNSNLVPRLSNLPPKECIIAVSVQRFRVLQFTQNERIQVYKRFNP